MGGVTKGILGLGDKSSEHKCDLGFSAWNSPSSLIPPCLAPPGTRKHCVLRTLFKMTLASSIPSLWPTKSKAWVHLLKMVGGILVSGLSYILALSPKRCWPFVGTLECGSGMSSCWRSGSSVLTTAEWDKLWGWGWGRLTLLPEKRPGLHWYDGACNCSKAAQAELLVIMGHEEDYHSEGRGVWRLILEIQTGIMAVRRVK